MQFCSIFLFFKLLAVLVSIVYNENNNCFRGRFIMWMGVNLLEWYDKNIEELVIYEDDTFDDIVRKVTEKVFEIEQKYFGLTHEEITNCLVFTT